MATQANIQIQVQHPRYVTDATVQTKIAAVDLLTDLQFPGIDQTIALIPPDTTTILAPGMIERAFSIIFTPEFIVSYPTDAEQLTALQGLFRSAVETQVPCTVINLIINLV